MRLWVTRHSRTRPLRKPNPAPPLPPTSLSSSSRVYIACWISILVMFPRCGRVHALGLLRVYPLGPRLLAHVRGVSLAVDSPVLDVHWLQTLPRCGIARRGGAQRARALQAGDVERAQARIVHRVAHRPRGRAREFTARGVGVLGFKWLDV